MLFIIDMQNDFVDEKKSKMLVKGSNKLVPNLKKKIEIYESKKDKIFYTLNIHEDMKDDSRDLEERKWGQNIYDGLKDKLSIHTAVEKKYYGISAEKASILKKHTKIK